MQNRWTLDSLDRVVIDLEDWDKSKPIVYTPEIEYSYLDLAIKVKSMFDVMDPDETPEGFLQKLFDVINSKLSVNLSLLSAMSYGFTVRDIENGDANNKPPENAYDYKTLITYKDKYFKLDETQICKTITSHMKFDCNMYIHPWDARGLSPREAARIQTFPDDYVITG